MLMKFSMFSLFISCILFCTILVSAQEQRVKIEDFIAEHKGLRKMKPEKLLP